jgi:hypothetical protein
MEVGQLYRAGFLKLWYAYYQWYTAVLRKKSKNKK